MPFGSTRPGAAAAGARRSRLPSSTRTASSTSQRWGQPERPPAPPPQSGEPGLQCRAFLGEADDEEEEDANPDRLLDMLLLLLLLLLLLSPRKERGTLTGATTPTGPADDGRAARTGTRGGSEEVACHLLPPPSEEGPLRMPAKPASPRRSTRRWPKPLPALTPRSKDGCRRESSHPRRAWRNSADGCVREVEGGAGMTVACCPPMERVLPADAHPLQI
jgi:hypothetical protein